MGWLRDRPDFEELLNYSLTLGGQGRSLGGFSQIHIPGKLINRGSGAGSEPVAPSFPLPLAGEPDGTPQGRRGASGAFGEGLREMAFGHFHTMAAPSLCGGGVGRFGLAFLELTRSV